MLDNELSKQKEFENNKKLHDFQLKELMLYPISKEYEDKVTQKYFIKQFHLLRR